MNGPAQHVSPPNDTGSCPGSILDRLDQELTEARRVAERIVDDVRALETRSRELEARAGQPRPVLSARYRNGDRTLPRQVRWGLLCWNRKQSKSYWKALPNRSTTPSIHLLAKLKLEELRPQIARLEVERQDVNRRLRLVRASLDRASKYLRAVPPRGRGRYLRPRQQRRVRNAIALTPDEIRLALRTAMGNVGEAAEFLGVSRRTLNRYMRQHGIQRPV